MYNVIKAFTDRQDNLHPYEIGDVYPRKGLEVSEKRIKELASESNLQGTPLIKKTEEPVKEKKKTKK